MENLIEKREKIAYRLRYANRQGWATELLEKEFEDIKNEIINNNLKEQLIKLSNLRTNLIELYNTNESGINYTMVRDLDQTIEEINNTL